MEISNDLIKKKKQLEQKISTKIIEHEIGAIHKIYFELPILQEIFIGTLLLLARSEQEYKSILACISVYLSRLDNNINKYFLTKHSDEDIYKILNNPENSLLIFKSSPFTNVWYSLQDLFIKIIEKNRVIDSQTNNNLEIYINTYPLKYPPKVCEFLSKFLKKLYPKIILKTLSTPFEKCPYELRTFFDLYFFNDITPLVSTDNELSKEFYNGNYISKLLFSRRVISVNNPSINIIDSLKQSKDFLNIFSTFSYLDICIPGIKYIPPVIDEKITEVGVEHIVP